MREWKRATFVSSWLSSTALFVLLGASVAQAAPRPSEPAPEAHARGERAIAEWNASNSWHYGTDPIFGLSRGLEENGLIGGARIAVLFLTVPLDLAQLPAALIAGFWGD